MTLFHLYISFLVLLLLKLSSGSPIRRNIQNLSYNCIYNSNTYIPQIPKVPRGTCHRLCRKYSSNNEKNSNGSNPKGPIGQNPYYQHYLDSINRVPGNDPYNTHNSRDYQRLGSCSALSPGKTECAYYGATYKPKFTSNIYVSRASTHSPITRRHPGSKKPIKQTPYYLYYLDLINEKSGDKYHYDKHSGQKSTYSSPHSSFKTTDKKPDSLIIHTSTRPGIPGFPDHSADKTKHAPSKKPFIRSRDVHSPTRTSHTEIPLAPGQKPDKSTIIERPDKHSGIKLPCLNNLEKFLAENSEKIITHSKEIREFDRVNGCCILLQDIFDLSSTTIHNIIKYWTGNSELLEQMLIQATTAFSTIYSSLYACKSKILSYDPNNQLALTITPGPVIDEERVLGCERDLQVENQRQYKAVLSSIRKMNEEIKINSNYITKVTNLNIMDKQCKEFVLDSCRKSLVDILRIESRVLSSELEKAQLAADIYTVNEILDEPTRQDYDKYVLKKPAEFNEDDIEDTISDDIL